MDLTFAFSGYVDPVIAALAAFFIYAMVIILKRSKQDSLQSWKATITLLTASVTSIALVKQSGIIVWVLFGLLTIFIFRRSISENFRYWISLALLSGSVAVSYYLYTYLFWKDFIRVDEIIKVPFWHRPLTAFQLLIDRTGTGLWILVLSSLFLDKTSRQLFVFCIAPLFILWAFFVSYDVRAAFIFFPCIALLGGMAMAKLWEVDLSLRLVFFLALFLLFNDFHDVHPEIFLTSGLAAACVWVMLLERSINVLISHQWKRIIRWPASYLVYGTITVSAIGLAILPIIKSSPSLLAENTAKRVRTNDQGFNERILTLLKGEPNAELITSFQLLYNLPDLKGRLQASGASGIDLVNIWLASPNIKYYLHSVDYDKTTVEQTRAFLDSRGIAYTEQKLVEGYTLFNK